MGFIRKVYAILSAQLVLTTLVGALFMLSPPIKAFVQASPNMFTTAVIFSFVSLIALMAKRHEAPMNMYLLAAFTCCEAYTLGVTVTHFDQLVVLQAFVLCAAITLGLTFFTFQTKYDFTVFYGTLITCLWAMIGLSIIQIFIPFSSSLELMYSAGGASLFSLFIVVDTQMMLNKLSTDEYILCAINLYLDIINLFLYILQAMSRDR